MEIGQIGSLHIYPLKSALGQNVEQLRLDHGGAEGDRTHALIDGETGRVVSAKRPQYWRQMLTIVARRNAGAPPRLEITLPDGRAFLSDDANADQWLSELLGRNVTLSQKSAAGLELDRSRPEEVTSAGIEAEVAQDVLVIRQAAPMGGFVDFAPIHIAFAASLRKVAETLALSDLQAARYRPNIVVDDSGLSPFAEHQWIGRRLALGEAELVLDHPTPRCALPTLSQIGLGPQPEVLRTLSALNRQSFLDMGMQPCLGLYASVSRPGVVRPGDIVRLL